MPVFVGTEGESMSSTAENVERDSTQKNAGLNKEKPKRKKREILPAETGRPETSKEFAARTSKGFVLKGPVERKEGGPTQEQQQISASSSSITDKERLTIRIPAKRDRQKPVQRQQTTATTTTNTTGISEERLREEDLSSRAR
ncbi:hypothetical protein H0H92_013190, partial [Tricholoma furcatifolium]